MADSNLSLEDVSQRLKERDASQPGELNLYEISNRLFEREQRLQSEAEARSNQLADTSMDWLIGPGARTIRDQRRLVGQALGDEGGNIPVTALRVLSRVPGIMGKAIPSPSAQQISNLTGGGEPGTASKATAGVLRANANAMGYLATLGPLFSILGVASPLASRVANAALAGEVVAHAPEMYRQVQANAERGDVEATAQSIAEMGLAGYFAARSGAHALSRGAAIESPLVSRILTERIKTEYTPEQMRDIYGKVNRGEGTPAENELVRFVNESIPSPGQAVRRGIVEETTSPRFNAPGFNEYMGVPSVKTRRATLSGIEPVKTKTQNERPNETESQIEEVRPSQEGKRQIQGPVEEIRDGVRVEGRLAPEPPTAEVPSPPASVMAIAKRAGKDVIPMTGPDSKVHWFTFDGFQEKADGSFVPQLTPVGPEPTPGLSKGSSYLMPKLVGFAPIGQLPWRNRLQLAPAAETIPQQTETTTPVYYQSGKTGRTGRALGGIQYIAETEDVARLFSEGGKFGRKGASLRKLTGDLRIFDLPSSTPEEVSKILSGRERNYIEPDGYLSYEAFEGTPDIVQRLQASGYDAIRISEGENGVSLAVLPSAYSKLSDVTTVAPVPAEIPKLRTMENQGDLLSNQTEDFALAGERGIDFERRERERAAAETRAREAAEIQAKQQLGFDIPAGEVQRPVQEQSGTITVPGASQGATDVQPGTGMTAEPGPTQVAGPSVPAPKRPTAKFIEERPPDIIDAIQAQIGNSPLLLKKYAAAKIESETGRPAGEMADYNDGYDQIMALHRRHPLRRLFAEGTKGFQLDVVLDALISAGALPEGSQPGDVWYALLDAAEARKGVKKQNADFNKKADQFDQFQRIAMNNERPREGDRKRAIEIPTETLEKGDSFKLQGVNVKVAGKDRETGETILNDGDRFGQQTVKEGQIIHADYRTLKKANQPESDLGAGPIPEYVSRGDDPFSMIASPERPSPRPSVSRLVQAEGVPAIREMIKASNLPANTKRVFDDFLSQPVMQRPEFNELVVAIRDKILIGGKRAGGVAEVDLNFIELSESDANPETLGHELFHFFKEMLPEKEQGLLSKWRREEIISKYGENASARLLSGNMTSEEAAEAGLPIEDYHLINDSEYLAGMFGKKFAEDSFSGRNDPEKQSLIDKIKAWLRELWASIKRAFKVAPSKAQMYEDILAGKIVSTPRSGVAYERRASFPKTPADARNAEELAQNAREREIEGKQQVAQTADIVKVLEKHGASTISPKSMALLRYPDFVGINVTGERMMGAIGEDYGTIKPTLDPYSLTWVARLTATQMHNFRKTLAEAIKARDELIPKVTSRGFLNTLMREQAAKVRTDMAEQNTRIMNGVLDTALKKAERVMRYEARSERAMDEVKGQIREMNEARNSSVALHQLVDDMVNVLATTPNGIQMLLDPKFGTRTDILQLYKTTKIAAGQTLHNPTLLKWGAYILQRNKRLRENLVAAHMAAQSPMRAAMTLFETELTDLLKKSPAKAIKEIGRGTARMATERERAKFAWRTLNKKVTERLEEFAVANDAAEVAEAVLADPDFKARTAEVNADAGWVGAQKPFEVYQNQTVLLPSGVEVDVSPKYFDGSKAIFQANRARIESAITDLKAWLNDPANADDLNYGTHSRNLETLENYFTGLGLLQPNDSIKAFNATFGILNNSADRIGGRIAVALRKSIRKYEALHNISSNWMQKHSFALTASRVPAMASHGLKWGSGTSTSLAEANQIYWERVLNPLAYSHNRQQGGFRVGDILPSGETVTKEDIEHLRMLSSAGTELYKAVDKELPRDESYVTDNLGGFDFYRKPLKGSELMTTRKADESKLGIAEEIALALETYRKADSASQAAALDALVDVLDDNWRVLGPALVFDRNADFARATEYDGPGGALEVLSLDGRLFPTARAFFDEVASLSGNPVEDVTKTLALEWARPISDWFSFYKPNATPVPRAAEQSNSFTQSRNQAMAPYVFYENGFKTSASMMQFGSGAQSRAIDELAKGFEFAVEDIQRQQREFEAKVQNLRAAGVKKPADVARSKQAMARENGRNSDNYEDIEKRLKEATRMRDLLSNREPVDPDLVAGRLIGFVTGSLIGTFTTLRNVTDGPRYVGQVANRLMGASLVAYPAAFWYGFIRSQLPFMGSAALTAGKTVPKLLQGSTVAVYRFLTQPNRSAGKFAQDLMEPFMKELGETTYNRIKVYREMMDRGIVPRLNPAEQELNARLLGSMLSGGQILDKDLTFFQKSLLAPIALGEVLFLNFSQKVNPKFGDAALNSGMYMLMRSGIGPIRMHEGRWRAVAAQIRAGARPWDPTNPDNPINRMSYQEIYPRGLTRIMSSEADLTFARDMFAKAGLDYDKVAFRVINEALAGGPARMTTEEENGLANATINMSNRASAANTPQFAKNKDMLSKWLNPFWNWVTRMLSNFLNLFSVPVRTGKNIRNESELRRARWGQWAYVLTTVILPLLVIGALFGTISNQELRTAKKLIFNQVMAYRQPWEREGGKSQAIGWGVEALNNIPILGGVMSMAINDIPVRASMDPNFVMLEKIKDAAKYVGGVLQTGDPGYKLPEFVMGMIPDTRIVLGRTEMFEGRQEANNAAALLRRYGPMDDMRTTGTKGGGTTATELSPYGDRMINAAMEGNTDKLQEIYNEAVDVARGLGKANPERVVTEIFRARNPYDRVFKRKITDDERQKILDAATPAERAMLEEVERKFSSAASLLGASANFTSEQSSAARSGSGMSAAMGAILGAPRGRSRRTRVTSGRVRTRRPRSGFRTRRASTRFRRVRSSFPSLRRRRRSSMRI